jgi:glucose-6-phosphate isomerase, archaeal
MEINRNIDISKLTPDIRRLYDMREVVYDKKWLKTASDSELYYMYRGVEKNGDLRYDITILESKMLGKEFNKTKGHKHSGAYGEVYMVLEGKAIYLMQKTSREIVEDVYAVETEKNQTVVIPPFYSHFTINPSKENKLKMANWMSDKAISEYGEIEKMEGACYFYTENGWIKNENYKNIPELRFEKPLEQIPEDLNFLLKG